MAIFCVFALHIFRLIQEKSFGNPGWIESYLLSLTQSGNLVTVHISKILAEEMGYVLPPIYMLKRSYYFIYNSRF